MEGDQNNVSSFSNLPKERKTGFVLLLVFGTIAVVLIFLQIRNTVYAPFALSNKIPASFKEQLVDNTDHLKVTDTDRDGLSDFDEQYVFGTSPYLYDTFGYGISDKDVVQRGLALCPGAGKNCSGEVPDQNYATVQNSTSSTVLSSLPGTVLGSEQELVGSAPPDLVKILGDPKELRKLLIQTGKIDEKSLNKISDSDLLLMASQMMSTTTQGTASGLPSINLKSTSTP
jgi:hypothetical protein